MDKQDLAYIHSVGGTKNPQQTRKIVSEEIHHFEEVRCFATAVGQRKQGTWTKWENAKDRAVTWSDLKHMEWKKWSFLIKAVYDVLPTSVNFHAWGLTTSDWCRACRKTANRKHILTGCEYALRSYTWRHNEILEIFTEASKICCEIANKALNIINNRAIQFIKEGNVLKIPRENMHKPSLLEGCTDWHVATDLKYNFIFPTEIVLTKHPDIVIWSVKAKKVFVIELMVPFEKKIRLGTSAWVGKIWGSAITMCQKWLDNKCISYWSRMQRFYCRLNLCFLD